LSDQPRARVRGLGADLHLRPDHRLRIREAARRADGRGEARGHMRRGTREYATWSIGLLLVLIFALLPVIWILSLSLKTPETVGDGRFYPKHFTLDNYKTLFDGGFTNSPFLHPLINSIVIALI